MGPLVAADALVRWCRRIVGARGQTRRFCCHTARARRTLLVVSARAVAAAAALLVIVTSCTGSPVATKHRQEQPSPTAPTKNGLQIAAERHTIADRILRARSRAVREHDEKAWLAPLDPSNTALVQRERRLFENLGRLPLQVFTRDRADLRRGPAVGLPGPDVQGRA